MSRAGLAPLLLSVLMGCGEEDGSAQQRASYAIDVTETTPEECQDYASDSNVFQYCLYSIARFYEDTDEVDLQCGQAGEWEADCRHNWVAARMKEQSGFTTEDLIEACAGNEDCTFELLDFRPHSDLSTQLNRCFKYAGRFRGDCAKHSAQRWWLTQPDEEEWTRVASLETPFPEEVGYWLGVAVACESIGACASAHATVQKPCQRHVDTVGRRPDRCPARTKKDIGDAKALDIPDPSAKGGGGNPPSDQ